MDMLDSLHAKNKTSMAVALWLEGELAISQANLRQVLDICCHADTFGFSYIFIVSKNILKLGDKVFLVDELAHEILNTIILSQ